MRHLFIVSLGALFTCPSVFGQVGIGTNSPNVNSILDLSNSTNKVLVLPSTSVPASSSIGNVYFNTTDSTFNYHDGIAYNALSAWKFKYNSNNNLYTEESVGIGVSNPQTSLHLRGNGEILELEGTDHTFLSFYPDGHSNGRKGLFGFSSGASDDIILKNETTTGDINIDFTNTSGKLNVNGKVQEAGYDLVPQGSIIMWSGDQVPGGWVLCDGGTYPKVDGSGNVIVPDLRERFIVGAGLRSNGAALSNESPTINQSSNSNNTSVSGNGSAVYWNTSFGSNTNNQVTLTEAQMPIHNHAGTTSTDGNHSHTYDDATVSREEVNGSNFNNQGISSVFDIGRTTATAGNHNHTFTTDSKGSGQSHENRPPFFALAFIIKL